MRNNFRGINELLEVRVEENERSNRYINNMWADLEYVSKKYNLENPNFKTLKKLDSIKFNDLLNIIYDFRDSLNESVYNVLLQVMYSLGRTKYFTIYCASKSNPNTKENKTIVNVCNDFNHEEYIENYHKIESLKEVGYYPIGNIIRCALNNRTEADYEAMDLQRMVINAYTAILADVLHKEFEIK